MKIFKIFTHLLEAKPGEHIFYEGIWYKVIEAVKESLSSDSEVDSRASLTITAQPLPEEELCEAAYLDR